MKDQHCYWIITLSLLAAIASASCKSSNSASTVKDNITLTAASAKTYYPIGMNDITIAFPAREVSGALDVLPHLYDKPDPKTFAAGEPQALLDDEPFMYPSIEFAMRSAIEADGRFQQGFDVDSKAKPEDREYQKFVLIGMRIDPCANDIQTQGNDKLCAKVMRLVWQPILQEEEGEFPHPSDMSFHTIYLLSEDELKATLKTLSKLHAEGAVGTFDLPLMTVHPVMQEEGIQGQYFKGALGLVHRYARASKLIGVATMQRNNQGWIMLQGSVANKKLHIAPIPSIDRKEWPEINPDIQFRAFHRPGGPSGGEADLTPRSTSTLSLTNRDRTLSIDEKMALTTNPLTHNALNIDCMACHRVDKNNEQQRSLKGAYSSRQWNLKTFATGGAQGSDWNFSMFTYNLERFIGQRVVNETANVLDFLVAKSYLKALPANPNPRIYREPAIKPGLIRLAVKLSGKCLQQDYVGGNGPVEQMTCDRWSGLQGLVVEPVLFTKDTVKLSIQDCLSASADFKEIAHSECETSQQQQEFIFTRNTDESLSIHFAKAPTRCLAIADASKDDHAKLIVAACRPEAVEQKFVIKTED